MSGEPFTEEELCRMARACRTAQERAAIYILTETGLRASEVRTMRLERIDWENERVKIVGKGDKVRTAGLSPDALAAITDLARGRREGPVFESRQNRGHPIGESRFLQLVKDVARRAGVHNAHPHRFRRTFAVLFLRMGGDAGALKESLGHTTLTMALYYARWEERVRGIEWQHRLGRALAQQRRMALAG